MARYKDCTHCGDRFRLDSQRKKRVGGKINECPDCVEELQTETAPIIRGFVSGSAKQAAISFVRFENEKDAIRYGKAWRANSGWNNQRSGGLNDVTFTHAGANATEEPKKKGA